MIILSTRSREAGAADARAMGRRAFTILELLVAMAVLLVIVLAVAGLAAGASRIWVQSERNTEQFQNGRAILELISRELAQAGNNSRLQLVDSPGGIPWPTTGTEPHQAIVDGGGMSTSSLFWQAPVSRAVSTGGATPAAVSDLSIVGYYLARYDAPAGGRSRFQLRRVFIPPTLAETNAANPQFRLYNAPPDRATAPWITGLAPDAFDTTKSTSVVSVVSDGVIGFWIRCFDATGQPIDWMYPTTRNLADAKFNSAGCFQPAIASTNQPARWTNPNQTAQTFRLPASIEVTLITADQRALSAAANAGIPQVAPFNSPTAVLASIDSMNAALRNAARIKTARTFSTRVSLINAGP